MTDYIAEEVIITVDTALRNGLVAWNHTPSGGERVSSFKGFARNFIHNVSVGMPILLVALVYVTRAKPHLSVEEDDWAYERVFLGALITAAKVYCPAYPGELPTS